MNELTDEELNIGANRVDKEQFINTSNDADFCRETGMSFNQLKKWSEDIEKVLAGIEFDREGHDKDCLCDHCTDGSLMPR